MLSPSLKEKLKRLPFVRQVEGKLLAGGHSGREAEMGALLVAFLDLFLVVILLNSFAWGLILSFTSSASAFMREHPAESVLAGFLAAILGVSLVFRFMKGAEDKRAVEERARRRQEMSLAGKRDAVRRGAMADFEEVFRADLARKYPDVQVLTVYLVDTTPRIRFRMARFATEQGGNVDANYKRFREKLFADALNLIRTAFELSPNIPAVIVDAIFNFISRKAQFYDGAVLSVKARRDVFNTLQLDGTPPFKALAAFDLRYNDGLEVEAHPEEESKSARLLERLRREMPKSEIRYESAPPPAEDGWSAPPAPVTSASPTGSDPAKLAPDRFSSLVVDLLSGHGFDVRKLKKIPGGTFEILARHPHPVLGGDYVALARQYPPDAQVHAEMVAELDQLVVDESCQRGLYIVSGLFTEEARNIARRMPVTLVDGRMLKALMPGTGNIPVEVNGAGSGGLLPGVAPDLEHMSLTAFQEAVEGCLKGLGFEVRKIRKLTDGAIFARVEDAHPLVGGEFVVMARQVPAVKEVPGEVVRETSRVMEAELCRRGILLVTGNFTGEARLLARSLAVELVDGNRWIRLFAGPERSS